MQRYFLFFEYDGTDYAGFQRQPKDSTIQGVLEEKLSLILREKIAIVGAGRTDSGVHASSAVAHFDVSSPLEDLEKVKNRLNAILPQDIAIHSLRPVLLEAHARYDARLRRYEYRISNQKSAFKHRFCRYMYRMPDFQKLQEATQCLLNYKDFATFCKAHGGNKTTLCDVKDAHWEKRSEGEWVFSISSNRFLRDMVRAIVGTLIEVGLGKLSVSDFCKKIERKDRREAAASAPPEGLSLVEIVYPNDIFMD